MRNTGPSQPRRRTISSAFASRSSAGSRSSLLSTSQRGSSDSAGENSPSSWMIASAASTGSDSSKGATSTTWKSSRVRVRCLRKRSPRPAPSEAPSISPGTSAITKCSCMPSFTTPRLGTRVVKG